MKRMKMKTLVALLYAVLKELNESEDEIDIGFQRIGTALNRWGSRYRVQVYERNKDAPKPILTLAAREVHAGLLSRGNKEWAGKFLAAYQSCFGNRHDAVACVMTLLEDFQNVLEMTCSLRKEINERFPG